MRIGKRHSVSGFTLTEMLVVLALISLIAGIAAPVVSGAIVRAKEAALREDLHVLRKAIDDYVSLKGVYPGDLHELVDARLVRAIPEDPFTEHSESWVLVKGEDDTGIIDVKSGAFGNDTKGGSYSEW